MNISSLEARVDALHARGIDVSISTRQYSWETIFEWRVNFHQNIDGVAINVVETGRDLFEIFAKAEAKFTAASTQGFASLPAPAEFKVVS